MIVVAARWQPVGKPMDWPPYPEIMRATFLSRVPLSVTASQEVPLILALYFSEA